MSRVLEPTATIPEPTPQGIDHVSHPTNACRRSDRRLDIRTGDRCARPSHRRGFDRPDVAATRSLPSESGSSRITRFSFLAYGDTRGRHDGVELQAEHTLVVESMIAAIKRAETTSDPIRFVLQSGDAVVNGSIAKQLSVSYIPLINRLTQEGGVPYFLSVGNHDVGSSLDLADPRRVEGLRNYFAANARLIPPEGSPRRLNGYPTYSFGFGNTFSSRSTRRFPTTKSSLIGSRRNSLARSTSISQRRAVFISRYLIGAAWWSDDRAFVAHPANEVMPMFRQYHVRLPSPATSISSSTGSSAMSTRAVRIGWT
jgi:hypothetical protein